MDEVFEARNKVIQTALYDLETSKTVNAYRQRWSYGYRNRVNDIWEYSDGRSFSEYIFGPLAYQPH